MTGISTRSKVSKACLGMLACLSLTLFGCAGTPTLGERMIEHSQGGTELGQLWSEGQELVRKGEKLTARGEDKIADGKKSVRSGEEDMHDGQQMVEEGRDLAAKGRAMMSASEATYQRKFPRSYQQLSPGR